MSLLVSHSMAQSKHSTCAFVHWPPSSWCLADATKLCCLSKYKFNSQFNHLFSVYNQNSNIATVLTLNIYCNHKHCHHNPIILVSTSLLRHIAHRLECLHKISIEIAKTHLINLRCLYFIFIDCLSYESQHCFVCFRWCEYVSLM